MANVFISHRSADLPLAERLGGDLKGHGHTVWLDEWKIGIGDSIVGEIEEGLTGAAYVILCLSSAGVHSPWMSREWMSTLARQLEGKNVKLLPVRLSGGEPPALLADIKYADLVKDWPGELAKLLKAIR